MESINLKIGSDDDNDIVIRHKSISRHHVDLVIQNGVYWLLDKKSSNGTYINDRRIKKYVLSKEDTLKLGDKEVNLEVLIAQVENILQKQKTDFTDEYNVLINQLSDYYTKKSKIASVSNLPKILRIGLTIGLVCVLLFFPDLIPDPNMRYVMIVAIGTLPVILTLFDNKNKKQEAADLLKLEYEDILKCPKCKARFLHLTPTYLRARGKCINDKCNATYKAI